MERERVIELTKRLRATEKELRDIRQELYADLGEHHRWHDIAVGRLEAACDQTGSAEIALGVAYDIKYEVEK